MEQSNCYKLLAAHQTHVFEGVNILPFCNHDTRCPFSVHILRISPDDKNPLFVTFFTLATAEMHRANFYTNGIKNENFYT